MNRLRLINRIFRFSVFFTIVFCFGVIGILAVPAKDTIVVTSNKIVEIDQRTGTMILQDAVRAERKSTGSSLSSQYLQIVRDTTTDVLIRVLAEGEVVIVNREQTAIGVSSASNRAQFEGPVFVWCDHASFNRATSLAELKGSVRIESEPFTLDAESVRYHTDSGLGRILPPPDGQVRFVVRKGSVESTSMPSERTDIVGLADEILINRSARKITLQGNAHIIDIAEQSEFRSQRADIFITMDEQVDRIIATERFSMNQPGRFSKADQAVFEYQEEEVILIGNAYVKEESQIEITSNRIHMHMKADKGVIRGAGDIPVRMEIPLFE
jgi:lipopolysaccharide export system protein LptA